MFCKIKIHKKKISPQNNPPYGMKELNVLMAQFTHEMYTS